MRERVHTRFRRARRSIGRRDYRKPMQKAFWTSHAYLRI